MYEHSYQMDYVQQRLSTLVHLWIVLIGRSQSSLGEVTKGISSIACLNTTSRLTPIQPDASTAIFSSCFL